MKKPEYQFEPLHLATAILLRGYIKPWELLRIVSWKSAKGTAWLSLNSETQIVDCTSDFVFRVKSWSGCEGVLHGQLSVNDWNMWENEVGEMIGADKKHSKTGVPSGLLRLSGVGYPVATALLSILKPDVFPVMDKWAVETIFGPGASRRRWQHKAAYRAYTERLVKPNCVELDALTTLRERDIAAMNAGRTGRNVLGDNFSEIPKAK